MELQFISNKPGPEGRYPKNLYFRPETKHGRAALVKTPGLVHKVTPLANVKSRGMIHMRGKIYAVQGTEMHEITYDSGTGAYSSTSLGTVPGNDMVRMAVSATQVAATRSEGGTYHYTPGTSTFTSLTTPNLGSITFQDGYFLGHKMNSYELHSSQASIGGNVSSWLDEYANVTGSADYLLRVHSIDRIIWALGEETTQCYVNTGDTDFPFERAGGSFQRIGMGAKDSLAEVDKTLLFLDPQARVVRTTNYDYQVVSTNELGKRFAGYTTSDAIGFFVLWQEQAWYVITFPSEDITWVYDASTNSWFQWGYGPGHARHRASTACYYPLSKHWLVGDHSNGKIYALDADTYTDDGESICWERTTPDLYHDGHLMFFNRLKVNMKMGVGLAAGHGIDSAEAPKVMLDWSHDQGNTWSNERTASMGKIGEYDAECVFRRIGKASHHRAFRLRGTEDTMCEIYSFSFPEDGGVEVGSS